MRAAPRDSSIECGGTPLQTSAISAYLSAGASVNRNRTYGRSAGGGGEGSALRRGQREDLPRFCYGRGPPAIFGTEPDDTLDERGVRRRQRLGVHDELDVQGAVDLARLLHLDGLEDHGQVEGLDFRLNPVGAHLGCEPVDELGRILVDAGGEV